MNPQQFRILLIEDNPGDADLVTKALSKTKLQYKLQHAKCMSDAIIELSDGHFDTVLVDLSLPDSLYTETITTLRDAECRTAIVVLTALSSVEAEISSFQDGVQDYVLKDEMTPAILERTIRHAVERHGFLQTIDETRQFLQAVLNAIPDAMVVVDRANRVVLANSVAQAQYRQELAPDDLYCQLFCASGTACQNVDQLCPFRQVVETKSPVTTTQDRVVDDVRRVVQEVTASPVFDKTRQVEYVVLDQRDITSRVKMEEELQKKAEELRQAKKLEAVGLLAGGIAHEFNNLLQVIQGYTKLAMEEVPPDGQCLRDLETVLQAGDRAAVLTRQLLGFSRRQVLHRRHVKINEVVANILKMIKPVIGEQIEFQVELDERLGAVNADPAELHQILLNLCINARDAMPSGGKLFLKTEGTVLDPQDSLVNADVPPGPYVVITLADTGCGIPLEIRDRVFEPFFTTKEVGKGTGLGLATVYGIVRQHGGTIQICSETNEGTTFKVYLPRIIGETQS